MRVLGLGFPDLLGVQVEFCSKCVAHKFSGKRFLGDGYVCQFYNGLHTLWQLGKIRPSTIERFLVLEKC